MIDKNLARSLLFIAIALAFGLSSLGYQIGELAQAGPGLFPLMVSCLLLLIGLVSLIRARVVVPEPMTFKLRNILIILVSIAGFALVSELLNVTAGVFFLVFCSSLAASSRSWQRSLKISVGLAAIAFGLHHLLGLNLSLY